MARDLTRLLSPKSIAVIGGGAWCRSVLEQCVKIGFAGPIWPVHPTATEICGLPAFQSVDDLPGAPDASFVGVNRHATLEVVSALAARGAGGAVCFASGFREAQAEDAGSADLQDKLLEVAGDMALLGPNCYGFINYLDAALLWPDQHGGVQVDSGVAIVTQSSNIALNLTMHSRGLPLAYVVTAGNQAQTGIAEIGQALLCDDRVSCLGLHIEGFGDLRAFEALAAMARELGKTIVALKVGKSQQAQAATISHTASLAGGDVGANALMRRLGILKVDDLPSFLETLKLLHVAGRLNTNQIASISCSGGEASLAADLAHNRDVVFPDLTVQQKDGLRAALGPMVALANPLDYNTYIWRDTEAMTRAFAAMAAPQIAMTLVIADFPRGDRCDPSDWDCVIDAVIGAKTATGKPFGLVASLPELMPEAVAEKLVAGGVVPFSGLVEALIACEAASQPISAQPPAVLLPSPTADAETMTEAAAKEVLAAFGVSVPGSLRAIGAKDAADKAQLLGFPVALKGEGFAHKSEASAVVLNLNSAESIIAATSAMRTDQFLIETMVTQPIAELLVGVVKDPAHGFVMTIGAGGVLTELMQDSASFLLPATDNMIVDAFDSLGCATLLDGYRGAARADKGSIINAIRSIEAYVLAHADGLEEVEINPLICTQTDAVAADALIRRKATPDV